MRRLQLIAILFCLSYFPSWGQQELFVQADNYFNAHLYKEAIQTYEKALKSNPNQPIAILRLAESYRKTNNLQKAEEYYALAVKYPSNAAAIFEYALVLKSNNKLNEAKALFEQVADKDPIKGKNFAASCDFVQKQIMSRGLFEVKLLDKINSKNADFAPAFYGDKLLFASSRSVAVEKNSEVTWTNDAFNQYYLAEFGAKDTVLYTKPLRHFIGRDINDAPMSYTKNGNMVAISSNNYMDGIRHIAGSGLMMDIYLYQTKSMKEWDHETELFFPYNAGINAEKPFSTGHPCFAPDGSAIYFSSDRPGGFGGYDIYVSYKTSSGWSAPKNLGQPINTPGNEMSPFLDEYGRFYFSSDWHHGYGGMDVFTAERANNGLSWINVTNLGMPVNSPYDDLYFIFKSRDRFGYFSSNRPGGLGNEDIYKVIQTRAYPLAAKTTLELGEKVVLLDVYGPNQVELSNIENPEFNSFVKGLIENNQLLVQINAHTDSRGSHQNNLVLSQQRARGAFDYLVRMGVAPNRIRYQGFGEQYLLNTCRDGITCSEDDHRQNRRTEFIVIGHIDDKGKELIGFTPKLGLASAEGNNIVENDMKSNTVPIVSNYDGSSNPNGSNPNNSTKLNIESKPNPVVKATNPTPVPEIKKTVRKSHYAIGDVIEVANIYYENNQAKIDEKNSPGLVELLEILKDRSKVVIEIGSYTDTKGSDTYNLDLSQRRANAVRDYLIKQGIAADRLIAKGYGESKIINRCKEGVACSEEEHAVNRRTEFKVVAQQGFQVGDVIKVEGIYYEFDKEKLDVKKSSGLQEIVKILKDNEISVEIRSHTDSRGSATYNLDLSEKRAKTVYDYLVSQGVNKHRLKYKGYGETMLLNRCKDGVNCSGEEHAANRRTDFKVIGLK